MIPICCTEVGGEKRHMVSRSQGYPVINIGNPRTPITNRCISKLVYPYKYSNTDSKNKGTNVYIYTYRKNH